MLFSGCWAVSVEPPVWVWKRSSFEASALRGEALRHDAVPHAPGGAELGHLLEDVVVAVEEEGQAGPEVVDVEAGIDGRLHVRDGVGEREGDLLHRRRAGLADVVAGDGDGVPAGDALAAVGEDVGDDPHRRAGRVDVGPAGDVLLEQVVLDRPATDVGRRHPLLLGHELVEQEQDGRRRVDGHRRGDLVERETGQEQPHVLERVDGHADLADLALGAGVVGVVAHLGREVEGARQAGLAGAEEEVEALVGRLGRAEAGVLAHRPQPAAVHGRVDAAGVGRPPRRTELAVRVPAVQVLGRVERADLDARVGHLRGAVSRIASHGASVRRTARRA